MSLTFSELAKVEIASAGKFKYILIKLKHKNEEKCIVRGSNAAKYHSKKENHF
jgi:hypothetical protein